MTENPFESPPSEHGEDTRPNPLTIPAIGLAALSAALFLVLLLSLPRTVMSAIAIILSIDFGNSEGPAELAGLLSIPIIFFAISTEVFRGSIGMLKFNQYPKARAAAIVAMIPVCSPFIVLGIPFGIWAFVLLQKPDIKARFKDAE